MDRKGAKEDTGRVLGDLRVGDAVTKDRKSVASLFPAILAGDALRLSLLKSRLNSGAWNCEGWATAMGELLCIRGAAQ
jgi:hypothetical protein